MKPFRYLRRAFLVVAGSITINAGGYAQDNVRAETLPFPQEAKTISVIPKTESVQFDYAFGDQTAQSLGLPGATGKDWGVRDSFHGFKEFIEAHPDALKGKNVFVAIGNGGMWETFFVGPKFAKRMIEAVGDGHVVLLGISEDRTDMDGARANNLIKKQLSSYGAIYGGALIRTSTPQKVYPRTKEEFAANHQQAIAVLRNHLQTLAIQNRPQQGFKP